MLGLCVWGFQRLLCLMSSQRGLEAQVQQELGTTQSLGVPGPGAHTGVGFELRRVCIGVRGRAELGLSLALLVCTAFEQFFSVLPEEMCLWAEQMLWGWGLAVF